MADSPVIIAQSPEPKRRSGGKGLAKLKEKLKSQGRSASERLKKAKRERWMDAAAAGAAPIVVGGIRRLVADSAERKLKADLNTPEGREAVAAAREAATVPHVKALGQNGTAGLAAALLGLASGSPTLVTAGASLVGAEVGMRVAGYELVDSRARKLRDMNAGKISAISGDEGADLAGDDDEVGAIPQAGARYPAALQQAPTPDQVVDFMQGIDAEMAGLDDDQVDAVAAGLA